MTSLLTFRQVRMQNAAQTDDYKVPGNYDVFLDSRPLGEVDNSGKKWRAWTITDSHERIRLLGENFPTRQAAAEALL